MTTAEITAALRAPCPYCKAPVEVACVGRSPGTRRGPHPERVAAGSRLGSARAAISLIEVADTGLADPPPLGSAELREALGSIRRSIVAAPHPTSTAIRNIAGRLAVLESRLERGGEVQL